MRITDVIRRKGAEVVTVRPDHTVTELLALLAEHRIGALVVSTDGARRGRDRQRARRRPRAAQPRRRRARTCRCPT